MFVADAFVSGYNGEEICFACYLHEFTPCDYRYAYLWLFHLGLYWKAIERVSPYLIPLHYTLLVLSCSSSFSIFSLLRLSNSCLKYTSKMSMLAPYSCPFTIVWVMMYPTDSRRTFSEPLLEISFRLPQQFYIVSSMLSLVTLPLCSSHIPRGFPFLVLFIFPIFVWLVSN